VSDVFVADIVRRVSEAGDAPVLRFRGQPVTGASFSSLIFRYARALDRLDIGRGDIVALFAPNTPDAIAIRYAANLIGAASCYLSAPQSAQRRAAMIARIDPSLLVAFGPTAHLVPEGTAAPLAFAGEGLPGTRLDELAASEGDEPVPCRARPEDLGVVASSGGTTGVPKGSVRSFAKYTMMVQAPEDPSRRQLINGKLAYLSQTLVDTTLAGGGTVILRDTFDAADTLATIEAEKITDLLLLEPQLEEVISHADVTARDLSSLRMVMHGGASAPPALRRRARARLGPVIGHGYGASEVGFVSVLPPRDHDRPERFTCAGRVRPGAEVRFRAPDGTIAEPGEPGTIEVRSPLMADGYRNMPDRQAIAFMDGWYRTGDLGRLDNEGFIHILGRAEDALWRDGNPVTPDLVQETVCQVPGVRFAVVVRDEGNWIVAVVPLPGDAISSTACQDAVSKEHGIGPSSILVFSLDQIPVTEQGKPDPVAICTLGQSVKSRKGNDHNAQEQL
jgi:fatty-acyl-CoA synthase